MNARKLLSLLLCLVMIFGLLPGGGALAAVDDEFEVDNIGYRVLTESGPTGTVAVDYCRAGGNVVIPPSVTSGGVTYDVTAIGEGAFESCLSLESVDLPDGLESIGDYAFYDCPELASVSLPDSLTFIGEEAFTGSGLTSITLPPALLSIGRAAFSSSLITSVTVPASVYSIGDYAFGLCSELEEILVEGGNTAFSGHAGVLFNIGGDTLITYPEGKPNADYAAPPGVTAIAPCAFMGCEQLVSVNLPDSLESIGDYAFYGAGLTSVTIPDLVTSIGMGAFLLCTSLESAGLPANLTSMGMSAFLLCTSLESVSLPANLTSIGEMAFAYCTSLESISLPANLTSMGMGAFLSCTSLESINFPANLTSIGEIAFALCTSLESVSLPANLTSIGEGAFTDCASLESVSLPAGLISIGGGAFTDCTSLLSINIPDTVTAIGPGAFQLCTSLETMIIPESVTTIEDYVFYGCSSLALVILPDTMTEIGEGAFYDCSLAALDIPAAVYSIGEYAFGGSFTAVYFEGNAPAVTDNSFALDPDPEPTLYYLAGATGFDADPYPQWNRVPYIRYNLTIANGVGGGPYRQDRSVLITANAAPAGQGFVRWEAADGGRLANADHERTLYAMPACDAAVTAIYGDLYMLTYNLNGGAASESLDRHVAAGRIFPAAGSAGLTPPVGKRFKEWNTAPDGSGASYSPGANCTMPASNLTLYAIWVNRPSGGSGNPPPGGYNAKTDDGKNLPVTVDKDQGQASVDLGPLSPEGTVITIPSIPGVDAYSVVTPASFLSTAEGQGTLTFNTGLGDLAMPSNMLTGLAGISGDRAEITIGLGDKDYLPDDVKEAIGDRPLIQLTLSIDGKRIDWNNPNAPVTLSIPYTPTAEELADPESIVVWYIDGSGNAVCVPNGRYDPAAGRVTVDITHFSDYAVAYNKVSFKDVAATAWYGKAVSFTGARGITTGAGGGNFSPDARLTRGQFIVMLMKAYEIAPDANPKDNFADAGDTYYTGYLAAAKRLGITGGVGNNLYRPGREITRQEMFTLLYNALQAIGQLPSGDKGKTMDQFTDAGQVAPWAKESMTLLVKTGAAGGSGGKLLPLSTTTRAEMAQVLYNLLGK